MEKQKFENILIFNAWDFFFPNFFEYEVLRNKKINVGKYHSLFYFRKKHFTIDINKNGLSL